MGLQESCSEDLEAGQGRPSVCIISSGFHCLNEESRFYALLYEQDSRPAERKRNPYEDVSKALSQTVGDCLDIDEEKGAV